MKFPILGAFTTTADARRCLERIGIPFGELDREVFVQVASTAIAHKDRDLVRAAARAWFESAQLRRATRAQRDN